MLTVDHYEIIRRKVRDGMSQRGALREAIQAKPVRPMVVERRVPMGRDKIR